jgi:hypothetical protein
MLGVSLALAGCTFGAIAFLRAPAAAAAPTAAATLAQMPTASEQPFVTKASTDLEKMYPTAADAVKAGYIRFTDEDETGAISYANRQWTSSDADHPSQLWYDVSGKLIGADYSVPLSDTRPQLFGIDPGRWITFRAHVHYGLAGPNGTTTFGGTGGAKFTSTGGSISAPTAAQLVTAGIAKSTSDVQFVFPFPAIWDLEVWVVPNPSGAFAEMNPNVHPVHTPPPMRM